MLYEITIPGFIKGLQNLSKIVDKGTHYAENKKAEPEVLPNSRLALDQFNFIRQIQISCDTAKLCASRLSGKDAPKHDDSEKTMTDLKARIASTIDYLQTITAKDFNGAESKKITTPRWEEKWLTGMDYALHHAIPNFHFHMTTAYAILRHNGVEVGKKDYLGELPFQK
jgi:uncharacterized protein